MDKEIETLIDEEYKSIYSNLNLSWLKGLRIKKEEIKYKGLSNSGVEQSILTNYAISLVKDNNLKIKDLIEKNQKKFDLEMAAEKIEDYINKSIDNNVSYLEKFEKDLSEYFDKKKMPLVESCKIQFRNAKLNNKAELSKIKKELVLINKSKNKYKEKSKRWLSKETILVGIIIPIVLFILGLFLT